MDDLDNGDQIMNLAENFSKFNLFDDFENDLRDSDSNNFFFNDEIFF